MGSSGTGSFGDLKTPSNNEKCLISLKDVVLEEVGRCDYYSKQGGVPSIMHPVEVREALFNGRIVVVSVQTNESIGYLPSHFSYLLGCMKKGHKYEGTVTHSANAPIPKVMVNLDVF